jgi:hypothetical protein
MTTLSIFGSIPIGSEFGFRGEGKEKSIFKWHRTWQRNLGEDLKGDGCVCIVIRREDLLRKVRSRAMVRGETL